MRRAKRDTEHNIHKWGPLRLWRSTDGLTCGWHARLTVGRLCGNIHLHEHRYNTQPDRYTIHFHTAFTRRKITL